MNLTTTALSGTLAALVALVAAAASAGFGFVSSPAPGASVWVVLVALTAGYWAVFVRWARR
ncbi:hypothetical protein [Haloferax volcanii]|uniref:Uncharacterized protein n=2 Tax=Haloferax volcanii TaxID=2246 RepID=A0A558GF43_HALVO|nr:MULTISPECIES: hypothetical protein [Haloferax]ELZ75105.1 hypothetical protein C456_07587 [Haloferax lucentense DSM 14919]NLV03466.1 hypothetical protein [Haloferax alexandrinus]TVT96356.1 hypothetical protein FQA18_01250 [Haloferax volcanii]